MNIAIVTASIGHGHNSVALALQETLHDDGYHNTQIFDILDDSKISQLLKSIYLEIVAKTPYLYSKIYSWTQHHQKASTFISYFNFLCYKSLTSIKKVFKPDIFIFTHPFPVVGYRQSLKVPAWTIITDYSFHPIWYNPKIRGYFVANTETQKQLCKTNYPMDRVFDTGIPLKKSFSNTKNIDRSHTKSDNHKPLILIMGGGLGIGGLKEIVDELDKLDYPFESIVLTGKNHSLYQDMISSFKKNKTLRWSVLQFSNDIHLLMRKASLLISKAGAITLTEALVSNLPTIIYKPIPGHEEENARFACKQEWAIWAKNSTDLILTTESLLSSPEKLARMRQKSAQFSKPFSTRNITRIIMNEVALPMEKSL